MLAEAIWHDRLRERHPVRASRHLEEQLVPRAGGLEVHRRRIAGRWRECAERVAGIALILLALIRESGGIAAQALESLGITEEAARQQVEEIIGRGQQDPPRGHIPFTPRAKKALQLSMREAIALGHAYIGTEHILLGFLREDDGAIDAQDFENAAVLRDREQHLLTGKPLTYRSGQPSRP